MKIDQIVSEGPWDNLKSAFNRGRRDYIAKKAAQYGISGQQAPAAAASSGFKVDLKQPTATPTTGAQKPPAAATDTATSQAAPASKPVKKTLKNFIKEIDGLKPQQQKKIYYYLQDKLF
jgi:hypothetical protein